ncbi:ATP-binding cassette domain-containing protein [Amedibacillus sp. YH-ame10]
MNNKAIVVKGLKKAFKDIKVLKDVNIEVEKGMIYSLLGSNGAGKTTTIKILTTLLKADAGSVFMQGIDVLHHPNKIHSMISLTGQYAAVDESLTGMENLIIMGRLHHIKDPKDRANELLRYFDLVKAKDRLVATYSGGMRRKLDIAMSLINEPSIIFLDEPTTGLDPQSRHAMWEIIRELNANGVTIFLTTQYLEEAELLADRIAILHDGRIIVQGTPDELKQLLPQGVIEFRFHSVQDLDLSMSLLEDFPCTCNHDELSMTIISDGSISHLSKILNIMDANRIVIQEFIQKKPSLEDVFLTLINEREAS